jgi:hypothetical protein
MLLPQGGAKGVFISRMPHTYKKFYCINFFLMIPNEYEKKDWKKGQTFQKMKCLSFENAKNYTVTYPPNTLQNFS